MRATPTVARKEAPLRRTRADGRELSRLVRRWRNVLFDEQGALPPARRSHNPDDDLPRSSPMSYWWPTFRGEQNIMAKLAVRQRSPAAGTPNVVPTASRSLSTPRSCSDGGWSTPTASRDRLSHRAPGAAPGPGLPCRRASAGTACSPPRRPALPTGRRSSPTSRSL